MSTKRDYYEVLGVQRTVTQVEIKKAYRRLAVQWHPDRNQGDRDAEEKFKEAAEAYAVLSEDDKRARYDRFGHAGVSGAGPGGAGFDPTIFADFSDILGDLFGFGDLFGGRRGRGGRRPVVGADLRYDVTLEFEEGAFGCTRDLAFPRLERCDDCGGVGSAGGEAPSACNACRGAGQVRFSQGFLTVARPCPQCRGEGVVVENPCPACNGDGLVERERTLEVTIPAGVETGARLRLGSEGEHGRYGGPPGDLFVVIRVAPHPRLHREGAHVIGEVEITYSQAVLGASVGVETVHGEERLELPSGTEPGRQFRLKGKGVTRLDGRGRGDHIAQVRILIPRPSDISEEQRELLKELAEVEGRDVKERRSMKDRVKDLFQG